MNDIKNIVPLLVASLPDWKERIEASPQFTLPYAAGEIENRIAAELRRVLEGGEDDEREVRQAATIGELVSKYHRELLDKEVPAELAGQQK